MTRFEICLHNLGKLHAQAERRKKQAEDMAAWRAKQAAAELDGKPTREVDSARPRTRR